MNALHAGIWPIHGSHRSKCLDELGMAGADVSMHALCVARDRFRPDKLRDPD